MNENPTDGDQGYVAPDLVPPAEPVEEPPSGLAAMPLSEPDATAPADSTQAPPVYEPLPVPNVEQPPKQKLSIAFFILGFVTPWLATAIISVPIGFLTGSIPVLGVIGGALPLAVIAAQIAGWLIGRSNGNNRLRSWGLGGVISIAIQVLAALLFFGACLLNIGGLQNQLGM